MTSSEQPGKVPSSDPVVEADLATRGWKRCFIADEPRLSEAVEVYEEMGLDVKLVPVSFADEACAECMKRAPDRYRVIFTREKAT